MNLHSRILIWMIRMVITTQPVNSRIDFYCINVVCAPLQSTTDIVPRTRSNYQDIGKRCSAGVSVQQMWQSICGKVLVSRHHLLVIDPVHRKRQIRRLEVDLVVRRPKVLFFDMGLPVVLDWSKSGQPNNERQSCKRSPVERPSSASTVR